MSREVLELLEKMDKTELKNQLALQCAPLLAGIKPSNLLTLRSHSEDEVYRTFQDTDIAVQLLCRTKEQTVFLLYRREELLAWLHEPKVRRAMQSFGYEEAPLCDIFDGVCARYERYMTDRRQFPHELGLLLGYPVEDVLGFVEHGGLNYLYSGYWKVYANVQQAKETFARYMEAKELLIRMASAGMGITAMLSLHQIAPAV
ncbi:MAG: DUF3793 family protein [Roseburia sp.]|nr:DUF3793 family protein [Roseburia sp.]